MTSEGLQHPGQEPDETAPGNGGAPHGGPATRAAEQVRPQGDEGPATTSGGWATTPAPTGWEPAPPAVVRSAPVTPWPAPTGGFTPADGESSPVAPTSPGFPPDWAASPVPYPPAPASAAPSTPTQPTSAQPATPPSAAEPPYGTPTDTERPSYGTATDSSAGEGASSAGSSGTSGRQNPWAAVAADQEPWSASEAWGTAQSTPRSRPDDSAFPPPIDEATTVPASHEGMGTQPPPRDTGSELPQRKRAQFERPAQEPSSATWPEAARPEPGGPEAVRSEYVRPEPVRSEPVRPEPVRSEPVRPQPTAADAAQEGSGGYQAAQSDGSRFDAPRGDAAGTAPTWDEPAAAPGWDEPAAAAPTWNEAARPEPRQEASRPEPTGYEASRPEPSGYEASRPEPSGYEASRPEPSGYEPPPAVPFAGTPLPLPPQEVRVPGAALAASPPDDFEPAYSPRPATEAPYRATAAPQTFRSAAPEPQDQGMAAEQAWAPQSPAAERPGFDPAHSSASVGQPVPHPRDAVEPQAAVPVSPAAEPARPASASRAVSASASVPVASRVTPPGDESALPTAMPSPQPRVYGRPAVSERSEEESQSGYAPPSTPPAFGNPGQRPVSGSARVAPPPAAVPAPAAPAFDPVVHGPRSYDPPYADLIDSVRPTSPPAGFTRPGASGDRDPSGRGGYDAPFQTAPAGPIHPSRPTGSEAPSWPAEDQDQGRFDSFKQEAEPKEEPKAEPVPQVRNGRVLLAVLAVAVLLLVVPLGIVWLVTQPADGGFNPKVGDCVQQAGQNAKPVDCASQGAYSIVSKVDTKEQCPDPGQPHVIVEGNGKDQVLCLKDAAAG
ncbi:hypothetical protein [Micromonospora sp. NPDC049679]|uniref:LppU/SCO3897 family protein n=1 Tax=Micromonospora sp. NPDC049679 TaxID=3155920 RepID=UPI0033E11ED7